MVKITHPRGQWTAKVSGFGTLPVVSAEDLQDDVLVQTWQTRDPKDTTLAQKQFDAFVGQLTAGNPERRIRAVVVDATGKAKDAARRLYEFTLANVKVNRLRNGTASYTYRLVDAQALA